MEIAITICIIIICCLLLYIFLAKRELVRVRRELAALMRDDSNCLIHSDFAVKEIVELVSECNNMLSEVNSLKKQYAVQNRKLKKMITNISHDIRTPLTSALGYIGIAVSSELPEDELKRELEIIRRRLERMEELIDSFFEFTKYISADRQPETEILSPANLLEEVIISFYKDYFELGRSINYSNKASGIKINANKEMLKRIFENLIANALKHGDGDLEINIGENEDNLEFRFRNEVLSEVDTERIFDEFYTDDVSRSKKGTGLGLAIAKEFSEAMGMKIWAEKEKGQLAVVVEGKKA